MSTLSMLKFRASIFAAVLTIVPMSPTLHAQDADMAAQVNVPFAFNTASQHYAPGLYRLTWRMTTPADSRSIGLIPGDGTDRRITPRQ